MQWLGQHLVVVLSSLLAVSELLAVWFPSIGGIMAGVIKGLKALGAKEPGSS